jgi:LysM repeat protein
MDSLRQIGTGILFAVISIAVILGGFALATAEGQNPNSALAIETAQPVIRTDISTVPAQDTPQALASAEFTGTPMVELATVTISLPTSTPTPVISLTPWPTSQACPPPAGWIAIIVQPFDTLASLAQTYQLSQAYILQGNCLTSDLLQVGSLVYVPPMPTAMPRVTSIPCGAPYGWVNYYVVTGDTLYNLSVRYRVSVEQLKRANCLGDSSLIQAGKILKVPNVATTIPTTGPTAIPSLTDEPTVTEPPATEVTPPTIEPPTSEPPTEPPTEPPSSTPEPPTPETPPSSGVG